jgi:hypothetical protein
VQFFSGTTRVWAVIALFSMKFIAPPLDKKRVERAAGTQRALHGGTD